MNLIHRYLSPRGMTGLASICAATAVISWIGHRSLGRLSEAHAGNQSELTSIRRQIDALTRSLDQQQSAIARDTDLAASVNHPPLSRTLAEFTAKLPADCCAKIVTLRAHDDVQIVARCADVTRFAAQTANLFGTYPTVSTTKRHLLDDSGILFSSIGDPTGSGFGWSGDLSATVVFTIHPTSTSTRSETLATTH